MRKVNVKYVCPVLRKLVSFRYRPFVGGPENQDPEARLFGRKEGRRHMRTSHFLFSAVFCCRATAPPDLVHKEQNRSELNAHVQIH